MENSNNRLLRDIQKNWSRMNQYIEIEKMHSGESADLFEVQDSNGGIFLKKQLINNPDEDQRNRFLNEISILKEVSSKFIIPIIDSDTESETPFYIMPRADKTLRNYTREKFGYSELGLMDQIVEGLNVLHQKKTQILSF